MAKAALSTSRAPTFPVRSVELSGVPTQDVEYVSAVPLTVATSTEFNFDHTLATRRTTGEGRTDLYCDVAVDEIDKVRGSGVAPPCF